jgi:methionyl-tRNA formyltransferase
MGTPAFAVPTLSALANAENICRVMGVFCQPDRPQGRGQKTAASPVSLAAEKLGIPVETPVKMRAPETEAILRAFAPDLVVVAAYGRILPPTLLGVPVAGCINVHASLLPRHRGASPIAHAILSGDAKTGVSIMKMDEGCDTGPVYCTQEITLSSQDTAGTLTPRLAQMGADLLRRSCLGSSRVRCSPQPRILPRRRWRRFSKKSKEHSIGVPKPRCWSVRCVPITPGRVPTASKTTCAFRSTAHVLRPGRQACPVRLWRLGRMALSSPAERTRWC